MAQATFHAPRRKRKVYESYESPFPIPLSHDCSLKDFRVCEAEIINNFVIVRRLEDIELLYGKGYFGKGILSRSRPEYHIGQDELRLRWKDSRKLPIISSRKYQHHVEWARNILEEQGHDSRSVMKLLGNYTSIVILPEDKDDALDSGDRKADQEDLGHAGCSTNENIFLEGNPIYDPLEKYGLEEMDTEYRDPDQKNLEKMHCLRHDDIIIHCGRKPEKHTGHKEESLMNINEHEFVLVQEEEEEEGGLEVEDEGEQKVKVKKERLVCRRNPFRIIEYLQLSREEAFFLVYALGCLSITYRKEPLTIQKLWEIFSAAQTNFQTSYMAYHHFRCKGWVPKVGLKYGTDLLLYRKGPPFYHASYSVIVELIDENLEGSPLRPLTWRSLSGLNRTTMNVSKELLICYLIKPLGFTDKDLMSPECIRKFKIQEVIVSRWISSRERMEHDEL